MDGRLRQRPEKILIGIKSYSLALPRLLHTTLHRPPEDYLYYRSEMGVTGMHRSHPYEEQINQRNRM